VSSQLTTRKVPIFANFLLSVISFSQRIRTSAAVLIGTFCQSFAFMALSYYQPLYFQALGSTPLMSGVRVMPFSVSFTLSLLLCVAPHLTRTSFARQIGSSVVSIAAGFYVAKVSSIYLIELNPHVSSFVRSVFE